MQNFVIRIAQTGDVETISTIHAQCWRSSYFYLPTIVLENRNEDFRRRQWTRWFQQPPAGFSQLYVVEHDGAVSGFAYCCANTDRDIPQARGELHAAYILPERRGGPAGGALLLTMMNDLEAAGLLPASLWTWQCNPIRITYGAAGFVPVVHRDRIIAGQAIPEVGYVSPPLDVLRGRVNRFAAAYAERTRYQTQRYYQRRRTPGFAGAVPD